MARIAAAAVVAAVASVAATACGGKDEKSSSTTAMTRFPPTVPVHNEQLAEGAGACGLISQADISAAVGVAANPGSGIRTKTNESCRWTLRAGSNQYVAVIVSSPGRQQYEQALKGQSATEQLSGVADQAFVAEDTAYALKGDRLILVEVSTSQPVATRKQAATDLIRGAVNRV